MDDILVLDHEGSPLKQPCTSKGWSPLVILRWSTYPQTGCAQDTPAPVPGRRSRLPFRPEVGDPEAMRIRWRPHLIAPTGAAGRAPTGRVPVAAVLAHDLARAVASTTGRHVTLDDLEAADRIAMLLINRWQPRPTCGSVTGAG